MPKIKTHRGAAKRFKLTGTGKIKRSHENKSHLLTHKSAKRTRRLRGTTTVNDVQVRSIKILLGM